MNNISHALLILCLTFFSANAQSDVQADTRGGAQREMWKKSHYFEKQGDYEKAASVIKEKADANDEYALLRYGHLMYKQGKYNESIEAYDRAMEISPKSLDAKLGILLPYIAQQRWRQVKVYTRQILVISEWDRTANEIQMMVDEKMKKWHTLNRHAAKISRVYPTNAEVFAYYGRAKAWQGDKRVAKDAYEKVLMREPENSEAIDYINDN